MLYKRVENIIHNLEVRQVVVFPVLNSAAYITRTLGLLKTKITYSNKVVKWKQFISKEIKRINKAEYEIDKEAIMVYSSGSTGASKGIVLTNDGINATIQNYDFGYDYVRGDIFLQMIPIWFSTGNVLSILMPLQKGISVILEPRFNAEVFLKNLKKYPVGLTLVATSIWVSAMKHSLSNKLDLSAMKYPITGGEQILSETEDEINEFLKKRGCQFALIKGYGMCEVGSTLTTSSRIHTKKTGVGYPILGKVTIAAFDMQTNQEMKYGERGEIRAITPTHMKCYFKNQKATAEYFKEDKDGQIWACTGDIGYIDEDGDLFVFGRATDSYISESGKLIYLFDAENVILDDDSISLCKVVDVMLDGKKVSAAHIVLKDGIIEEKAKLINRLYSKCEESLPNDEIPQLWKIRDNMPVHANGKRDVHTLKKEVDGYYDSNGNAKEKLS